MIFIPYHDPPEIVEPGEEAFNLPASSISPERSPILRIRLFPPALVRRNHLDAQAGQPLIQWVAVIGLVADEPFGQPEEKTAPEGGLDQFHFMRRSTFHVSGDRKTRSVCNGHDFCAFAPLRFAHSGAPFFAGAKVPSIKASRMSIPPRSRRSSAKARRISSRAQARTHAWNQRWHVWYDGYLSGRSFQGAPVLKIHRMPLSTSRGSRGGRPRPPGRCLGDGINDSSRFHCSSVRSISHKYYILKEKSRFIFMTHF